MTRRALLLAALLSTLSLTGLSTAAPRPNRLRLRNLHTGERIDLVYRRGGAYLPEAISRLDRFLRDSRSGESRGIDPRLFDLLGDLMTKVGRPGAELEVVCGYRTRSSNELLRRSGPGVAKHSLHVLGEAIDVRLPGTSTARLRDAALALGRGGVGYYPRSDFIHVDVGRRRRWRL